MKILYDLSYVQEDIYSSVYYHAKSTFEYLMNNIDDSIEVALLVLRNVKVEDSILKLAKKIEYVDSRVDTKKYFKEVEEVGLKYDRVYFPYQPIGHIYKFGDKTDFYFTMYSLKELVFSKKGKYNKYDLLYQEGFLSHLKYFYRAFKRFSGIWYKETFNRMKNNLENAKKVICVSNSTKEDVIKTFKINEDKLEVFYSPLKRVTDFSSTDLTYSNYFLFVSSSKYTKNTYSGLKALDLIYDNNIDYPMTVSVGHLPSKVYKKLRHKDKIISLDYVTHYDLEYLYQNALALIYPSFYEGFGDALLEAMKYKTRVIASNLKCLNELYPHALFFDPFNIKDIKEKILNYESIDKEMMYLDYQNVLAKSDSDRLKEVEFITK